MASAAESEVGALFENTQLGVPLRTTLEELGHKQPATPVQTDNTTACAILAGTVKQKRTRAMDMRFYWVRDRQAQGQYNFFGNPEKKITVITIPNTIQPSIIESGVINY